MNTHLKTAHDHGIKKALEKCGYASIEDVNKDIQELGILEDPAKTASETGVDAVMSSLKAKLG